MKKCQHCNQSISDDAIFCQYCGNKLKPIQSQMNNTQTSENLISSRKSRLFNSIRLNTKFLIALFVVIISAIIFYEYIIIVPDYKVSEVYDFLYNFEIVDKIRCKVTINDRLDGISKKVLIASTSGYGPEEINYSVMSKITGEWTFTNDFDNCPIP